MKLSSSRNACTVILALCGSLSFCSDYAGRAKVSPSSGTRQGTSAENSESFEKIAGSAQAAMEANRVGEAIRMYVRATELKPNWSEGWWHLGTLLFDSRRFGEARDAFVHFVSVERRQPGPGVAMVGLSDFELKRYAEALTALEHSLKLGLGDNADFRQTVVYRDGVLNAKLGHPEIALQRLTLAANRMAAAHPDASSEAVLGNQDLITAFGVAALRMPALPSEVPESEIPVVRLAGRAQALIALKDAVAAEEQLKELLAAYPSHPGVHYMYGVFLAKEHPPLANEEFRREMEISPQDGVVRVQLAFGLLNAGNYEEGLRYAQEGVTLAPKDFIAHVVCGRLLLELGKTDRAVQELRTAVRLAPDSPDAHFALSRALSQQGRTTEAVHERAQFEHLKAVADAHTP